MARAQVWHAWHVRCVHVVRAYGLTERAHAACAVVLSACVRELTDSRAPPGHESRQQRAKDARAKPVCDT
eukprot:10003711-Alexandrium_andersonii.AAC.1